MSSACIHGLKPNECYLCTQSTLPRGGGMPQFTTQAGQIGGNPTLEIFVNGQSWGVTYSYDEHFRFGVKKARLILLFSDLIEKFVETGGIRPSFGNPIRRTDLNNSPCSCATFPNFTYSNGQTINSPYMQLRSGTVAIGFGLQKAEALIDVLNNIKEFA